MKATDFKRELFTKRLQLRKFKESDAQYISDLLKFKEVASTTLMLPFPCPVDKAEKMILEYLDDEKQQKVMRWAITKQEDNEFIGGIRLVPNSLFNSAEIGFWLGKPFWRNGYTYEAAMKVIEFGFTELNLNRFVAHSMTENSSSIRLLEKLGFSQEGLHPELVIKWGVYKDVMTFGQLRKNYVK